MRPLADTNLWSAPLETPKFRLVATRASRHAWGFAIALLVAAIAGCGSEPQSVVVYTALDREFSQPIFAAFERDTGIKVLPRYDTESTKTVSLVEAIRAERDRPRCDLFWNNEALHTLRLAREGLLRPYASPRGSEYPADAQSPEGLWYGFAARARVLIVNTNRVPEARRPRSIQDITDVQWTDQVGIAKPLFGTTATHAACLFAEWGEEEANDFFQRVKRNARIMAGNKQVARAVAAGTLAFGLTDTDDAIIELEAGRPVAIVYPDQVAAQDAAEPLGTLFIPNTLSLMKGSEHPAAAQALLDYLLSAKVEARLAMGPSAQAPLNKTSTEPARIETPSTIRAMQVDFEKAAEAWETARQFLLQEFTAAK
ncbi:MAG: extracellular solute-binding protein [Planctomycetota bacterium]